MMNTDTNKVFDIIKEHFECIRTNISHLKEESSQVIQQRFKQFEEKFKKDLEELEANTEYKKFVIAFYGETNAGKSTLIETLRIYFQEATKQESQQKFKAILQDFEDKKASLNHDIEDTKIKIQETEKRLAEIIDKREQVSLWYKLKAFFGFDPLTTQKKVETKQKEALESALQTTQQALETLQVQVSSSLDECSDGEIIGTGISDFTRECKRYDMSYQGCEFILLDVPGIEGDEHTVKNEIRKATRMAHCVFYVKRDSKPPEQGDNDNQGTLAKIKRHLNAQTEVWAIFNQSAKNPRQLKEISADEEKSLKDLDTKMKGILKENYQGRRNLFAQVAFFAQELCLYPQSVSPKHLELYNGSQKFLKQYSREELLKKSLFSDFVDFLYDDILKDTSYKIQASIVNKACEILQEFQEILHDASQKYDELYQEIKKEKDDLESIIDNTVYSHKKQCSLAVCKQVSQFEQTVRQKMEKVIDSDVSDKVFQAKFESCIETQSESFQATLQKELDKQIKALQESLEEESKNFVRRVGNIFRDFQTVSLKSASNPSLSFDMDSGISWMGLFGSGIGAAVLVITSISNPIGWVFLAAGALTVLIGAIKSVWKFFSSDYKKSQQREARDKALQDITEKLESQYDEQFDSYFEEVEQQLETQKKRINDYVGNIKQVSLYFDETEEEIRVLEQKLQSNLKKRRT